MARQSLSELASGISSATAERGIPRANVDRPGIRRKSVRLRLLVTGAVALAIPASASAAVVYENQADFLSNIAPGYYLEGFNAYSFGEVQDLSWDFAQGSWAYTTWAENGLCSGDGYWSVAASADMLIIEFTGAEVTAIGADVWVEDAWAQPMADEIVIMLSDGTTEQYWSDGSASFRGFVSAEPITAIGFAHGMIGDGWVAVDNLFVGAAVPEPAALVLLAIGGLAAIRRRRVA